MDTRIQPMVTEIIRRLTRKMGADGKKGNVMVAVSAATMELVPAIDQLRRMVLAGFRLALGFSSQAESLHREWILDQLAGFPFVTEIEPDNWLMPLKKADAVVVPLLSLNTAAKAAFLMADTLPTNLILHGLAMGKPVIMATNGADPKSRHWNAPAGLARAMGQRLKTLKELGYRLTDVAWLNQELARALGTPTDPSSTRRHRIKTETEPRAVWQVKERTITVAHIRQAERRGLDIGLPPKAVITPLARETAARRRVSLITSY